MNCCSLGPLAPLAPGQAHDASIGEQCFPGNSISSVVPFIGPPDGMEQVEFQRHITACMAGCLAA